MADINEVATLEVHGSADSGVDQVVASLNQVSEAQTQVGETAGVSATQQETAAKGTLSAASAYDRLLKSIDPVAKAQAQFASGQATLQKALDQGLISTAQFSSSQSMLERSLLGMGNAARGAGEEINTLSARHLFTLQRSLSELGMGLATGASPFSLMAVGAEHAAYILSEGGLGATLSSIGTKIAAMITPTVALASGFAAVGVAAATSVAHWVELQDDIEKGLSGIGRASGVTSEQINSIAASIALVGTQSYSAAATAAIAFARVGQDATASIGIAVKNESLLVDKIGMDAPAASKALSAIFTDPVKGAEELNKTTGFLTASLVLQAQAMEAAGDHAGATQLIMQALNADLEKQASQVSGLSYLWQQFKNTISDISTAAGAALAEKLGLGNLQQQIEKTTAEIEKLKAEAAYSPVFNTSVAQANIKALEDHLAALNAQVAGIKLDSFTIQMQQLSVQALHLADAIEPAESRLGGMNAKLQALAEGFRAEQAAAEPNVDVLRRLSSAYDALKGAIESSTNADGTAITQAQKMTAQFNLQIQAINAKTAADKVALAQDRERLSLEGQLISQMEREALIQKAGQVEAAKLANDAATALKTQTAQYDLQIQAISAKTDAEKIALAQNQERLALLNSTMSAEEKELLIQKAGEVEAAKLAQAWNDYYAKRAFNAQSALDKIQLEQDMIGKTAGQVAALQYTFQEYESFRAEAFSHGITDLNEVNALWEQNRRDVDETAGAIRSATDRLEEMKKEQQDEAEATKKAKEETINLADAFKQVADSARVAGGIAGGLFDRIDQEIANWSNVAGPAGSSGGQLTLPVGANNPYPPGSVSADTWNRIMTGIQPGQIGGPPAYRGGGAGLNTGADVTFGGSGAPDSIFLPIYVSPGERMIVLPVGQTDLVAPTGLPGSLNDGGFAQTSATASAVTGSGGLMMPSSSSSGGAPVFGFGGPTGQTYPIAPPGLAGPSAPMPAIAPPGLAGPSAAAPPPSHWDLRNGPLPATGPTAQGHWTGIGAGTDYFWQSGPGPYVAYAASGLDYRIPGSGPPDSVSLPLHVSPGERLIVLPAGMAGMVPDLGLPGLSGAPAGGVFAASGLDTMATAPRAPASSGGLSADVAERLSRIEAAVAKFVDGQANGPPPLTMVNHISAPLDSNLGRSSPQVLAQLARDVAAVLASRR